MTHPKTIIKHKTFTNKAFYMRNTTHSRNKQNFVTTSNVAGCSKQTTITIYTYDQFNISTIYIRTHVRPVLHILAQYIYVHKYDQFNISTIYIRTQVRPVQH